MQTYSQELSPSQLDSLYNKFIQLRAPELLSQPLDALDQTLEERKCGFLIVNDIKSNLEFFSSEKQDLLKSLLGRPTLQTSIVSPSGFFRIHYDTTGSNRPAYVSSWTVDQNVAEVAKALDSAYRFEINYLGFLAPPSDGNGGSDDKYDIYIKDLNGAYYGYTEWESKIGVVNWTSFMVIDNDYIGYYSTGLNGMRVTVAHEFHHGIQLGNYAIFNDNNPYRSSDAYFYELTSTSMEEFVFDDVNDYYAYMDSYFRRTDLGFPRQNGYNIAIWNIFLKDNFGFNIIKRQWEMIPSYPAILSINQSLNEVSTSFPRELNKFGVWTFFTGFRRIPGKYFEEAVNYPVVTPTFTIQYPSAPPEMRAAPTANNFVKFNISANSDTLIAIVTNADAFAANDNSSQLFNFQYILYSNPNSGQRELTDDYSSTFSASDPTFWSVSEVLNNQLIREDSIIIPPAGSIGYAFPNPFYYSRNYLTGPFLFFPFDANIGEQVDFNVYSIEMELQFGGEKNIEFSTGGQTGVRWNVTDKDENKLASGVYIFVIKKGSEIVKGKVVIFNE